MKIQVDNFSLKDTILSGQCFRATSEKDGSFTTITNNRVINIKQTGKELLIKSNNMDNIENIILNYFDLKRDYEKINSILTKNDKIMQKTVLLCRGYHIMNQDSFEMIISYIISQNNNVKRISSFVNKLSEMYGTKVEFNDKEYYLFPTYEQMKDITVTELRSMGAGFRDKYIMNYLQMYEYISNIDNLSTEEALKKLMEVKGIGLKVASCILLFGYKRLDVFPIDTWVKQNISTNYSINNDTKSIENFSKLNFKEYSGLAIQYMFHSQRNK